MKINISDDKKKTKIKTQNAGMQHNKNVKNQIPISFFISFR